MPIVDCDGRSLRESICRILGRFVRDSEMAKALGVSVSTYSRRKDKPDFPSFGELNRIAGRLGVERSVLLVDFGYLDPSCLSDELQQRYAAYRNAVDVIATLRTRSAATPAEHKPAHTRRAAPPTPRIGGSVPRRSL